MQNGNGLAGGASVLPRTEREASRRNVIKAWLERIIRTGSYHAFEDLHIDVVDSSLRKRGSWIPGGVECLTLASEELEAFGVPAVVALGLSLRSHDVPSGLDASSIGELESELEDSPPSLYLFDRGDEPWSNDRDCRPWSGLLGVPVEEKLAKYLREWCDDEDGEFRRSFWFTVADRR